MNTELDGLIGGASRDRTDDLLRARQALYQMSYGPYEFILGIFFIPLSVTSAFSTYSYGGSGWTRTTDLTLIRGAL